MANLNIAKYRPNPVWQGVDTSRPANIIDPAASFFINNFILKDGEIRTRPRFVIKSPEDSDPGRAIYGLGAPPVNVFMILGLDSFFVPSLNQGNYQPLLLTVDNFYYWETSTNGPWTLIAGVTGGGGLDSGAADSFVPQQWVYANGVIWFPTRGIGHIVKGTMALIGATTSVISTVTGGLYASELAQKLIIASTIEASVRMRNRIRWSATADFSKFDPSVDLTAGFTDLTDVPDIITGYCTLGKTGYIFRTNGITEMIPTGQGASPFDFPHISYANNMGIGCYYPASLDSHGDYAAFMSSENVYIISAGGLQAIGGKAINGILNDIRNSPSVAQTSDTPFPMVIGSVVSMFLRNYEYPCYMITIPLGQASVNPTSAIWLYSINDQNWTRFTVKNWFTTHIRVTQIGYNIPGTPSYGDVTHQPDKYTYAYAGVNNLQQQPSTGTYSNVGAFDVSVAPFDLGGGNKSWTCFNTEEDAEYNFRIEEVDTDKKPTIRRLRVLYRDLGEVKITFSIQSGVDNGTAAKDYKIITTSSSMILGTKDADSKIKLAYSSLISTGMLPQVTITRRAFDGPLSIIGVDLVAAMQEGETL